MARPLQKVQRFLDSFLHPLASGGQVHVGAALDAEDLDLLKLAFLPLEQAHIEAGSPRLLGPGSDDVLVQEVHALELACRDKAAELWPETPAFALGPRLLELAVAAHNLLFMSHPVGNGWRVGPRGAERLEAFTRRCIDGDAPATVQDLLNRHVLLSELMQLRRSDVTVRFWAGSSTFVGAEPPARLVRFPRLRRVRQERTEVRWLATEMTGGQQTLLIRLLAQTPLTDLLTPDRPSPPFRWTAVTPYLSTPGISRLVCNHYLERGLGAVGPALARAFWRLTRDDPGPEQRRALRLSAQLVAHLLAATCLVEDPAPRLAEIPALARDPEAALGPIMLAALQCDLLPSDERLGDDETRRRLSAWMDAWRGTLGQAAEELSGRLLGALY